MFDYIVGDYLICLEDSTNKELIKGKKYRIYCTRNTDTFFVIDDTGERSWWSKRFFFNINRKMREMFAQIRD